MAKQKQNSEIAAVTAAAISIVCPLYGDRTWAHATAIYRCGVILPPKMSAVLTRTQTHMHCPRAKKTEKENVG